MHTKKIKASSVFLIFKIYDAYLKCFSLVAFLGQRLHSEDTRTLIYTCLAPIISSPEALLRTLSAPSTETAYQSCCPSLTAGRVCAPDWLVEELYSSEPVLSQGAHMTKARTTIWMLAENGSCSEITDDTTWSFLRAIFATMWAKPARAEADAVGRRAQTWREGGSHCRLAI